MSKVTALADTQRDREITMGDLYDALGSVLLRLDALTREVAALSRKVEDLIAERA